MIFIKFTLFILFFNISNRNNVAETLKNADLLKIIDLFAEAVIYDKHSLQLKIIWNSLNLEDVNIDIYVKPIKQQQQPQHCPNITCYEFGIKGTAKQLLIPKDPMSLLEHNECSIEAGCAYDIFLVVPSQRISRNISYIVPDCVIGNDYEICSCHKYQLPKVSLNANISASELNIFYNITPLLPNNHNIDTIFISVGKQKDPSLPWGGQISNITALNEPITYKDHFTYIYGRTHISLNGSSTTGSRLLIRAHVVDKKGCEGVAEHFFIDVPAISKKNKSTDIMKMIYILTPIFLTVLLVTLYFIQPLVKGIWKLNPSPNRLYRYSAQSSIVRTPQSIAMEENLLYVDTDILDARARGEIDYWEISHNSVRIGQEIGRGAFGRVYLAEAKNILGILGTQKVAVKQLKKKPNREELEEFYSEIEMMKSVSRHPNIVSLLSCCTLKEPFLMIMEYVGFGDLLQYLRMIRSKHEERSFILNGSINTLKDSNEQSNGRHMPIMTNGRYAQLQHLSSSVSDASYIKKTDAVSVNVRPSVTETMYTTLSGQSAVTSSSKKSLEYLLDHKELHSFAIQIARGMNHLEDRQITHRDLAARNILIAENKVLKISDFGLSRCGIYVNTRNKKVPLRWLSIEAIRDNLYSSKSDVWAFGIVLWEIGTLGGFPYPTINNHELLSFLTTGQRLQRPENCTDKLYDLMTKCWTENPDERPKFSEIVASLEPHNQKIYVDFNDISSDYVFPPIQEQIGNNVI